MADRAASPVDDLFSDCGLEDFVQQPESSAPFVGLWNLGNSCFFNSVLQILFFCPGFQKKLKTCEEQSKRLYEVNSYGASNQKKSNDEVDNKKYKLLVELQILFAKMREGQNSLLYDQGEDNFSGERAIRPSGLMDALREVYPAFEPYTQQDAQECLRCMLDILHGALSALIGGATQEKDHRPKTSDPSFKVFGGRKSGETRLIPKCDGKSQSENQDPTINTLKESRTTAARKRGVREVLKNFSRPKAYKHQSTKYKPLMPLGENKSSKKMTASETAALLMGCAQKECDTNERQSSLLPPLKKKKLNGGISGFYKTSMLGHTCDSGSSGSGSASFRELSKATIKAVLKPPENCKQMENFMEICPKPALTNFVEDLFQGQLINEVRCMECESRVQRIEDFMDISLPVKETDTDDGAMGESVEERPAMLPEQEEEDDANQCSVAWGLSSFTSHEILEGDNKYYCGKCHRYAEGERRLLLHKLPPVLTLHLKRFSSKNASLQFGTSVCKINSCLTVPLELSLQQWCTVSEDSDLKYTLFGIIVHSGATICSGHYLAYMRVRNSLVNVDENSTNENLDEYDGKWLEADDDRMRILDKEEMEDILSPKRIAGTSRTPYLLFYQRASVI